MAEDDEIVFSSNVMLSLRNDNSSRPYMTVLLLFFVRTDLLSSQTCDEPSQFTEEERPRPQGSSPVAEYPETGKYADADKEVKSPDKPLYHTNTGLLVKKKNPKKRLRR